MRCFTSHRRRLILVLSLSVPPDHTTYITSSNVYTTRDFALNRERRRSEQMSTTAIIYSTRLNHVRRATQLDGYCFMSNRVVWNGIRIAACHYNRTSRTRVFFLLRLIFRVGTREDDVTTFRPEWRLYVRVFAKCTFNATRHDLLQYTTLRSVKACDIVSGRASSAGERKKKR